MKTKKIILIAVAVAVVVGGGIWFFTGSPAKHKVMYASATVSKGDISNSVTATGTIEPVIEVEVGIRYHRQDLCRLQLGSNQRTADCRDGPCHFTE